jgi:hypothetical protein
MTPARKSPAAAVVEDWTSLAKELIDKWSDYGAHVSTNLDQGAYSKADTASADLAGGVSLTIETAFKLAWETLDSFTILTSGLDRRPVVDSEEFTVDLGEAKLTLKGNLSSGFGNPIPVDRVNVIPLSSDQDQTKFKLRVDATDCPAGTYAGDVRASKPSKQPKTVKVWITVP